MPSQRPSASAAGRPETTSEFEYGQSYGSQPAHYQHQQHPHQAHQHPHHQQYDQYEEEEEESDDEDVFAFVPPTTAEQQMEREREEAERLRLRMEEERRGRGNPFAFAAGGPAYHQHQHQHQQHPSYQHNNPYSNYDYPATADTTSSASSAPFAFSFAPDSRPATTAAHPNLNNPNLAKDDTEEEDEDDDVRPTTSAGPAFARPMTGMRPGTSAGLGGRPVTRGGGFGSFGVIGESESHGQGEMREVNAGVGMGMGMALSGDSNPNSPTSATPFVVSHPSRNPYFSHAVGLAPPSPSTDSAPSTGGGGGGVDGVKMRRLGERSGVGERSGLGKDERGRKIDEEQDEEEEEDADAESVGAGPVPEHGPAGIGGKEGDERNVPSRASVIRDRVQSALDYESRRSREVRVALPIVAAAASGGGDVTDAGEASTTSVEKGVDLKDDGDGDGVGGRGRVERQMMITASGRATPVREGEHPLSPGLQGGDEMGAKNREGERDEGEHKSSSRRRRKRRGDSSRGVTGGTSSRGLGVGDGMGAGATAVGVGIGGGAHPIGPGGMKPHKNHAGVVLASGVSVPGSGSRGGVGA
ncbi:hypothetical protein CVT24_008670, partial [Panaeolus cyanescens]